MKKVLIFVSLLVLSLVPLATVFASEISNADEVSLGASESSECGPEFSNWVKFDPPPGASQTLSGITVTSTAWKDGSTPIRFDWSSTFNVGKVVVKASTGIRTYGGGLSGTGLLSVLKDGIPDDEKDPILYPDNYYGISHITFCWNETTKKDANASANPVACDIGTVPPSGTANVWVIGADMTIAGPSGYNHKLFGNGDLTISETLTGLEQGNYTITYSNPQPSYQIPGGLPTGFQVEPCPPKENADAEADPQSCETGDETVPVFLSVTGATMSVSGPGGFTYSLHNSSKTFPGSGPDALAPGTYNLSYVIDPNYQDPGNLPASFTVGVCETDYAAASALVEACGLEDETEPVSLFVNHATMHVSGPEGYTYNLTNGSASLNGLDEGAYTLTYDMESGYEDPGNLPEGFTIYPCKKGNEFYNLRLSVKCVDYPNSVIHKWTVTNMNGFAVDFTWATSATAGSYSKDGSGTVSALGTFTFSTKYVSQSMKLVFSDGEETQEVSLKDGICKEDKKTDVPAGGLGPSVFSIVAPVMIGVSSTTLTWIMLKRKSTNK